ncbi:zwei Ig domain protein zig-8 [Stomoxys calcitrans]|uniref:Ig-like domain-containing protein n=1 Tax=Stomoxys calcitrans TaxID=35570 RepID=A0A1I8PCZ8_STOCA|nr:zwei Ig domain protein zig-8 [Stomoxys calcitrans]XP_059218919.1 zwei Ig domain protein zig-8 [Stomoxys calcitrans]
MSHSLKVLPMIRTMQVARTLALHITETILMLLVIAIKDNTTNADIVPFKGNKVDDETSSKTSLPLYTHPPWVEPYFDPTKSNNVSGLLGRTAYLQCRVFNLGNKTVSWVRHRDMHILTVGTYTYTSDLRFQVIHQSDLGDWILQIKSAQKRDAGIYECQISTQPVLSYFVNLNVVVPTASIIGAPDLHVDKGSTINLTCTVKFCLEPPAYVFWYHHEELINYDSTRGGVSVVTEKGDVTTSYLLLQSANLVDSGTYYCAPSNAEMASVRVHVLSGEHPEAMQTDSSQCSPPTWLPLWLLIVHVWFYKQQPLGLNATIKARPTTKMFTKSKRQQPPKAMPSHRINSANRSLDDVSGVKIKATLCYTTYGQQIAT